MKLNLFEIESNDNDFQYILANAGRDILINGLETRALITNKKVNPNFDDKYITTTTKINKGDRIKYNDLYWLIVSEVNNKRYDKYKGVIRACNHIIGFKIDNKPVCIPVIAYGSTIGIKTNNFFNVPENKIILSMQKNEITSKIKINDNFVIWNKKYIVEGIDYTEKGLIFLHCDQQIGENNIQFVCTEAGDINYKPWYIVITGETELLPGNTYSYIAKVYDGKNNIHDYLKVNWSLNDNANSSITDTGVLTTHEDGENITIYATLEGTDVVGELPVEIAGNEITYSLTGKNEITKGYSENYVATKYINGTPDQNAVFNFSIDYGENSSSIATLTVIGNTECQVKANSSVYYIDLIAQDTITLETVSKQIKLKNIF
jgi:hypothetical protein